MLRESVIYPHQVIIQFSFHEADCRTTMILRVIIKHQLNTKCRS